MKFAGKWMELENIILCEVTQTQKNKHGIAVLPALHACNAQGVQKKVVDPWNWSFCEARLLDSEVRFTVMQLSVCCREILYSFSVLLLPPEPESVPPPHPKLMQKNSPSE
ncbi:hypothetical protein STEG23_015532, partial [Scotinomys teguina]